LEAEKKTGKKVAVTFNYRFTPYTTRIKELIREGVVGQILNVHFEYMLDTRHGADYFRRWHRKMENSGGLMVHKATHHFDLVNWWLEEEPEQVMAFGSLRFYGPTRKERGERCLTCKHKKTCEFYFDLTAEGPEVFPYKQLYLDAEKADKYFRDRCVFAEEIDIYDTMSVNVKYSGGAFLSYSLTAHSPYEGYKISINGAKGRLEIADYQSGMRTVEPALYITFYDRKGGKVEYAIPKAAGGHGGGDERLQEMLFRDGISDPLNHQAGSYAGATSILTGIAANKSIKDGKAVRIKDLVPLDKYK
jgi:predicted dehydrogenase